MNFILLRFFMIFGLLMAGGSQAYALDAADGFIFWPSFSIRQTTGAATGDETMYLTDFRGGYRVGNWYFGMIYSRTFSSGNESSIGNTVGYLYGNFIMALSYYLVSSMTDKSAATGSMQRVLGNGTQIDVGYAMETSYKSVNVVPMLSYKALNYKQEQGDTGPIVGTDHSYTLLYPFIGLWITF